MFTAWFNVCCFTSTPTPRVQCYSYSAPMKSYSMPLILRNFLFLSHSLHIPAVFITTSYNCFVHLSLPSTWIHMPKMLTPTKTHVSYYIFYVKKTHCTPYLIWGDLVCKVYGTKPSYHLQIISIKTDDIFLCCSTCSLAYKKKLTTQAL